MKKEYVVIIVAAVAIALIVSGIVLYNLVKIKSINN